MEPGMVWLALVPLLGMAWIFVNVLRVAESLRNEFRSRRWHHRSEDYGYGIGLAYCCLMVASIIPYCGSLFGLAGLVCWIMYWVKIANLSRQIARPYRGSDWDDEEDDEYDDDDRPRRRRDEDEYDDDDDRPRRRSRSGERDQDDDRPRRRDRDDDEDDGRDERKPWDRPRR